MRTLTTQEIQFINTYLKNSGITYIDVRLELVDHIATALETQLNEDENLSFYDGFKSYMVVNKADLLSDYELKNHNNLYEITTRFSKNVVKPEVLFYSIITIILNYYFDFSMYVDKLKWVGVGLMGISYIVLYFPIERQIHKISLGGKMAGFIMLLFYLTIQAGNYGIILFSMFLILTYLDYKYIRKLSELKKHLANGLVALLILMPSMYLLHHFNFIKTAKAETYYQFFITVIWLVLIKTVYQLKKELYYTYKTVLRVN